MTVGRDPARRRRALLLLCATFIGSGALAFACGKAAPTRPTAAALELQAPPGPNERQDIAALVRSEGTAPVARDGWTIRVEGCASGTVEDLSLAHPRATLYGGDVHCRGKLLHFTHLGHRFEPAPGGFPNYEVGARARFVSADGRRHFDVRVAAQLQDPVRAGDRIVYELMRMDRGDRVSGLLAVRQLSVGSAAHLVHAAPAFDLWRVKLAGVAPQKSTVKLTLWFQCRSLLRHADDPQHAACDGTKLRDLRYALVGDDAGAEPCAWPWLGQCRRVMASATERRSVDPDHDLIRPGADGMPRGGFVTARKLPLTGPARLAQHPRMLFLLGTRYESAYAWMHLRARVALRLPR